ncbi:hypothetical protein CKA32_005920 [Geitlerinema sp. FC II]|nr:hypothetical protein CKA32_005920 [Geitlerinema sp. FC II]
MSLNVSLTIDNRFSKPFSYFLKKINFKIRKGCKLNDLNSIP